MIKDLLDKSYRVAQKTIENLATVEDDFEEEPTDWELAEAFRELGRLRIDNKRLRDMVNNTKSWTEQAKRDAGYDENVSFDDVFSNLLEFYNKHKDD
jgi:hypothetical protein